VVGTLGAAAAAARLLDLDPSQATMALGIAASQVSGLRENFGTMTKPLHAGQAAANGILAALLASRGYTAAATALDGMAGLDRAFGRPGAWDAALADLGANRWALENGFKPYPCGLLSHGAIDAAIALHGAMAPADIVGVECRVSPTTAKVVYKRAPRTGLEGKFSLSYCTAAGLHDGRVGVATFSDAAVARPELRALEARVRVVADERVGDDQAVVRVEGPAGAVREMRVEAAKGTPRNPMTDADLEAKYLDLATGVLGPEPARRLLAQAWRVGQLADVTPLLALAG
jgi:2-methylcitrate dehydratase PrpD